MFKKILIVLCVLIVVAAAALFFFLPYLDINRYKPQITDKIKSATGLQAEIGRITLRWQGILVVELSDLKVTSPMETTPFITADKVQVEIKPLPLLNKKIELGAVSVLQPKARLIKREGEWVQFTSIASGSSSKPDSTGEQKTADGPQWSLDHLDVANGELTVVQVSNRAVKEIRLSRVDIEVINPLHPSVQGSFKLKAAVFSADQNFSLKGSIGKVNGSPVVKDLVFDFDTSSVDWAQLNLQAPLFRSFLGIQGKVLFEEGRIVLDQTSAKIGGGQIDFNADFKDYLDPDAKLKASLKVDGLDLTRLIPPANPAAPALAGLVSGDLTGEGWGNSWPLLARSISGKGQLSLRKSAIVNLNVLRLLFEKLSQIPGVADALNKGLPPKYAGLANLKDTALPDMDLPIQIVEGTVLFPTVAINTTGLELHLRLNVALDGNVAGEMVLAVEQELSSVFLANVPALAYIADPQGRLVLPVKVSGSVKRLSIKPDMEYVMSRLVLAKGQELLSSVLQRPTQQ